MKKLMISILFIFVSTKAFSLGYTVSIIENLNENNQFNLKFVSTETHSSMCGLTITNMQLKRPKTPFLSNENFEYGKIILDVSVLSSTPCLMAFGPHRGAARLTKGDSLPSLPNGSYELMINNESHGILEINDDFVSFITLDRAVDSIN